MNVTESVDSGAAAELGKGGRSGAWWVHPAVVGSVVSTAGGLLLAPRSAHTSATARILGHHVVVAHGGATAVAFMVMFFIGIWVPGWAVVNAIRTPKATFASLGRSRSRWVASMVIVFLIGDASLVLVPIYYLVRVRARLIGEQRATHH